MNTTIKKPELLAPAGNMDALKAVITNGADAVYLGLDSFSARAGADNFTLESLKYAVDYAHLFGAKVYLAINTLIKESEQAKAISDAKAAFDLGVSAIIVQDLLFASRLKREAPHIVLHASTQMGVHNLYGAIAAKEMGLERVILSRETPLKDILDISRNLDIEIEYFVHGALCCAFSGNCYFSGLLFDKSGNRGRCLQLCRKPYTLKDKNKSEKGYFLSTKDTMLINDLSELIRAGVCSFKIEGRMRRKEYAAEVTRIYRNAIDSICMSEAILSQNKSPKNNGFSLNDYNELSAELNLNQYKVPRAEIDNLKLMFNRGNFSKAHLYGKNKTEIVYPLLQSHMGLRVGRVESILNKKAYKSGERISNKTQQEALMNYNAQKGDGLKFIRNGLEVGHALVLSGGYSTGFVGDVRANDEVYLTDSAALNKDINARVRKLPLNIDIAISVKNKTAKVRLNTDGREAEFIYDLPLETVRTSSISSKDLQDCLATLGNTDFECKAMSIEQDEEFFMPKSLLKQLKRDYINDFTKFLVSSFDRPNSRVYYRNLFSKLRPINTKNVRTIIMCNDDEIDAYAGFADLLVIKPADYAGLLERIRLGKISLDREKCVLDLPPIAFMEDISLLKAIIDTNVFAKFAVNNIYGLSLVKDYEIMLGYKMNFTFNQTEIPIIKSIECPPWSARSVHGDNRPIASAVASNAPASDSFTEHEMTSMGAKGARGAEGNERKGLDGREEYIYIYGRPDIMEFVHCYYSRQRGCGKCGDDSPLILIDDRDSRYEIKRHRVGNCYNVLAYSSCKNDFGNKYEKRFIDATNITKEEKTNLITYLSKE